MCQTMLTMSYVVQKIRRQHLKKRISQLNQIIISPESFV